ncbi:hypothetical protein BC829DRAFT_392739 [Chytridium lagenaria]|nr:hypothetical protein BC829DRAFT_392739 [Chytridium lagenaria]
MTTLANGYSEVGKPPVWRSTFQSDFTPKRVHVDGQDINTEGSHYINLSNFEIRSHSSDVLPPMISSTQKDYISKQLLTLNAAIIKLYHSGLPPYFRDENEIKSAHSSNPPPLNIRRPDSITTHFELGDDLQPHAPQTPVKIDSLDNRASTEEMLSTKQSDYVIANDLDRRDLIVDNKATVKDLKSTHFTLGTASFTQHPSGLRAETATLKLKMGKSKLQNMSTHQSDFVSFEKRLDMIKQMKMSAQELKNAQTKSSISFDFGALSLSTSSVPEVLKKHLRPGPVPAKRPVPAVTGPFTYSPMAFSTIPPAHPLCNQITGTPLQRLKATTALMWRDREQKKGMWGTTFQEHFGDPVGGEKEKKLGVGERCRFDSTLYNTVTR